MKKLERIMLVDDDKNTNFFNRVMLTKFGVANNIISFQSAEQALEYLRLGIEKIDLIFLDINMPIMNGWDFLEEYEQLDQEAKASILVIMLTASANPEDAIRARQFKSVIKYINKPLDKQTIQEIIDTLKMGSSA